VKYETAYHFLRADMTAGSGSEPPWKRGQRREIKGRLTLCERGYHSAPSWYDALQYAPGPVACIVQIGGEIKRDDTKAVSQFRKLVRYRNVERELRLFAVSEARLALSAERKAGREPDKRSWDVLRVARLFVDGKATDAQLSAAESAAESAARSAARSAAESAAESAARSAAESAARSAAESAALSAAESAARSAAWSAALSAAWSAAWSAAESAAWSAAESAARSAARSAAESAAWSAALSATRSRQRRKLQRILDKLVVS